ncbi:MAG: sigma-54 dependent transcriptional regulator [Bacteroidota bacterium]
MKQKKESNRIFVVEDDPMYQRMIRYVLELNPDHEVHLFSSGARCLEQLHLRPGILTLDYTLPDGTGEEVLQKIKAFNEDIAVVILSSQQDVSTAVSLLREGAYDYITKDSETKERLLNTINNIKKEQHLRQEVAQLREELQSNYSVDQSIIGNSPAMQRVFQLLQKAVHRDITISITGETGTGKEVIAKSIHYNSRRSKGPFVAVNMSAIPNELLESELFGHEKGAFTGAATRKKGLFELSDKGTLFLDEIAEMAAPLQAKVLRALQEREVIRVGGEKPISFDARIIVATHRDLSQEVAEGNFREDLYYRLLGLPIELPPLRMRENDILLLTRHFLQSFSKKNQMPQPDLSRRAKSLLLGYSFPGNVRELKAVIELAAVLCNGSTITEEDIRFNSPKKSAEFLSREMTFEEYKREIVRHYLEKYNNDIGLVAQKLNIGKSTIYRMLKTEKDGLSSPLYSKP